MISADEARKNYELAMEKLSEKQLKKVLRKIIRKSKRGKKTLSLRYSIYEETADRLKSLGYSVHWGYKWTDINW